MSKIYELYGLLITPDLLSWLTLVDDFVCNLSGEFVR